MPRVVNVLKPFVFSYHHHESRLPTEIRFSVGEHELSDDVAAHAWIKAGADGKIESENARLFRLKAIEDKKAHEHLLATAAKEQAEAAMARLERSMPKVAESYKLSEKDLNTPINELKAKHGADIDPPKQPVVQNQNEAAEPRTKLSLKK